MTPVPKKSGRKPAPRVPKSIPARSRWRATRSEILARLGEPTRLETELTDRLVLNLIEADRALTDARKDPIQTGSRGQLVEHPGFRIAARCESTALAIATKLGVLDIARPNSEDTAEKETAPVDRVEDELAAIRKRKTSA